MGWKLHDQCGVKDCKAKATRTVPYRKKKLQVCERCYEIIMAQLRQHAGKHLRS